MNFVDTERFGIIVEELKHRLPAVTLDTMFDVGANVGQTIGSILTYYPQARVFAFEPAPETFQKLTEECAGLDNVVCKQVALGAEPGMLPFISSGLSPMNRIAKTPNKKPTIQVAVQTGDEVCRDLHVERISYLKIDTEGHDLHVLQGFRTMLSRHAIDLIQVEAGLNPSSNTYHASMEDLKVFLEQAEYRLFHIQKATYVREVRDGVKYATPFLGYCNLVFVSRVLANRHSIVIPPT